MRSIKFTMYIILLELCSYVYIPTDTVFNNPVKGFQCFCHIECKSKCFNDFCLQSLKTRTVSVMDYAGPATKLTKVLEQRTQRGHEE